MGPGGAAPPVPPVLVQAPGGSGWIPILTAFAGVLGLLGVVVGAVLTADAQARTAWAARRAAAAAAIHDAVRELVATSDILQGLYATVWQLDRGDESNPPEIAFARALEAWANYQHARARVRVLAPRDVVDAAGRLDTLHYQENSAIELFYLRGNDAHGQPHQALDEKRVGDYHRRIRAEQQKLIDSTRREVPTPDGEQPPTRWWWPRSWPRWLPRWRSRRSES